MNPTQKLRLLARTTAVLCTVVLTGCAQTQFATEAEFTQAVSTSQAVIDRLHLMPTDDLGKLATSRSLQKKWKDLEEDVFEGTAYLGARIRHDMPMGPTRSRRLTSKPGTFVSAGRGRPAFGGYLGRGKAWTEKFTGPTYVYRLGDNWTKLDVYIAAVD